MNAAGTIVLVIFLLLIAAAVGWIVFTRMRARKLGLPPPSLSSYFSFRKTNSYGLQPAPGGITGWINDRIRMFKNRNARTATGAYEQPLAGGGVGGGGSSSAARGRRGFGPLDPDEAWDARVGTEADAYGPGGYYEEQELGLAGHGLHADEDTSYGGGGAGGGGSYQMNLAVSGDLGGGDDEQHRGRTRSRSPAGLGVSQAAVERRHNPFDDDAEPSSVSLRGVSPRPLDTLGGAGPGPSSSNRASHHGHSGSGDSPTERKSIFREEV